MKKELPVYDIHKFQHFSGEDDFYANLLKTHVEAHHFTNLPHKHDFYLVALFTHGAGTHEIDFVNYKVKPGALFIMKPGQMHYWKLSNDVNGYIFFHSRSFYDERYTGGGINDFLFYNSNQSQSYLQLKGNSLIKIRHLMKEITEEQKGEKTLKQQRIHALINLVYIELARIFNPPEKINSKTYISKAEKFEELIDRYYRIMKSAHDYADKLNITEKHLNRICRNCFNKTSTRLIAERIILEAKRLLIYGKLNVTEIGAELGYNDPSYFIRFFKKNAGLTPHGFLKLYK
jgi:AraC family transcriptional regulator, transcriptional activator of pobA